MNDKAKLEAFHRFLRTATKLNRGLISQEEANEAYQKIYQACDQLRRAQEQFDALANL